jgi:predicted TIM-barrel fold metal-dependent hydrolase
MYGNLARNWRIEMGNELRIIDNHVHIVGRGDVYKEDLYWTKKFEQGIGFWALKVLKGWLFTKVGDRHMRKTLLKQARKLKHIDHVVVLAFDNVYDVDGTYRGPNQENGDNILSTVYVSNKFINQLCKENSQLLLGMSVHPFRPDAVEELEQYKDNAVLCKWIASSQLIDMSKENNTAQDKLIKFYKKLAEIKLPLLYHTGVESSIPASTPGYEKFNSPEYIETALNLGVTVILAHCGCSYFDIIQDNVVKEVIELFKKQADQGLDWNLYVDISALFSPFRKSEILDEIFNNIPASKMIYGSDFPNPAKGRKESFLRPFLRFRKANLLNRYYRISSRWLKKYYSAEECHFIMTNLHRILNELGRGYLLEEQTAP